jgi:hypothetical protein
MRHSQLSNEQILLALSESYNIVAGVRPATKAASELPEILRRDHAHDAVAVPVD